MHAIQKSGLPYVEVDFYMASSEKIIETYILNGIVELIGQALGPTDKLIVSIKKYVKALIPKLNIGGGLFQLELTSDSSTDPASSVKEALLLIEQLLAEKKQQAVFMMDEFQNVGVIAQGKGIEAAIRHVAQKTKYLTIIFSGSNRKMLQTMFEDETRPLYKLCWKLALNRISEEHYYTHIQKASKQAWKQAMPQECVEKIIRLSERHPFYLNKLCDRLLTLHDKSMPTNKEIDQSWQAILNEEKSDAVKEISLLSNGQKKVLYSLANDPLAKITSKEILMSLQMTSSTVITAINGLEEKDVIEKIHGKYQIINPVVKYYALKK